MITDKQMVEAAKIIKKRCRDHDHCEGCPFDVSPYCPLDAIPGKWEIPDIPEVPSDKNE